MAGQYGKFRYKGLSNAYGRREEKAVHKTKSGDPLPQDQKPKDRRPGPKPTCDAL